MAKHHQSQYTTGCKQNRNHTCPYLKYYTGIIIRLIRSRMRWTGHVAWMGEKRNAHRILVGKPEGKQPLGRPRWVDHIKMDLREIGCDGTDWIDLAQDRDQWKGSCEHDNELSGSIKCWEILEWLRNLGVKCGRRVGLTTLPPSISRLSK
jgi:hypothetical protein